MEDPADVCHGVLIWNLCLIKISNLSDAYPSGCVESKVASEAFFRAAMASGSVGPAAAGALTPGVMATLTSIEVTQLYGCLILEAPRSQADLSPHT